MKLISGLIFVFLVGCASVPERHVSPVKQVASKSTSKLDALVQKSTAISPNVLYLLLTAEIAGQRNQYDVALESYLRAARRVDDPRIAERAAKIGLFLKDTKKIDEAVSLWLRQDNKSLIARKIAVLSALRKADNQSAVKHLKQILRDDPAGFEFTLIELTKTLEKEGKAEIIFNVLEDIAKQYQDHAVVFFVQGLLAGQLNKLEIAKEKANKALMIRPGWDKALILLAQLMVHEGEFDLAKQYLEEVLEKTPGNDKVRKVLTQMLIKTEAFDEAVQLYQHVLDVKPDDGESQFAIALIYLQQEKDDEALEYLKQLVNKPAWDARACFYIGRIEFKKEHYEKSLVWFDKVTQGYYVYDASMAAVSALLNQKNYAEAERRLIKLSAKFPKQQLNILLLKAEIYNEQKNYQKAFDLLTTALGRFSEKRDLLYTRSLIAEKLNRLDVLEADIKKILLKNPDDASALNALGYTLVDRTDRFDEAEEYLNQAIKLKPEDAVIIDSFGWLQFKQGKTTEALKSLRTAYEKEPEGEIAAHLAEVLWVVGNKGEAKDVFNKAMEKSPDDEYLLRFKQRFLGIDK